MSKFPQSFGSLQGNLMDRRLVCKLLTIKN